MNNLAGQDQFDRLPDELVLFIFDQLCDAKSLTVCLSVSKRFASLIPLITSVFLSIPCHKPISRSRIRGFPFNVLKILVKNFIPKRFQFLHQAVAPNPSSKSSNFSFHLIGEFLKKFEGIRCLHIELPSNGGGIGSKSEDCLVRWKAEFGSEIKTCIILGATSFQKQRPCSDFPERSFVDQERDLTDNELKFRVVWIISSLISASARHHLLKQVLAGLHPLIQRVTISDAKKQGKLCMGAEHIDEMRKSMKSTVAMEELPVIERTRIPELSIKLWYVAELELPTSGWVMKGATLVVIGPADDGVNAKGGGSRGNSLVKDWFDALDDEDRACGEAVRTMMKMNKKNHVMTMSSF